MAPPPPLTPVSTIHGHWECVTCAEDFSAAETWPYETDHGDTVCRGCIRRIFEQAYQQKYNRPARWGGVELSILDFTRLFRPWFVEAYERQRVSDLEEANRLVNNEQRLDGHIPQGFVRGKDYQRCPKCMNAMSLASGCNHLTCTCMTNFCFICGREALEGSDHWTRGGCPRYNQPENANAQFDDDEIDDDEIDDDEIDDEIDFLTRALINQDPFAAQADSGTNFSLAIWAWNTTMQSTDDRTRDMMQRIISHEIPRRQHVNDDVAGVFGAVYNAMLAHRPLHTVNQQQWDELVLNGRQSVRNLLPLLAERRPDNNSPEPIMEALLRRPIGGVFNMVNADSRRQAYNWAHTRQQDFDPWDLENPLNFAIFDVGPGGMEEEQLYASHLMEFLEDNGRTMTEGRVEFWTLLRPNGFALLAKFTGVGARIDNPLREVASWLIVPPPVRLALSPDLRRQTPEQRQQSARIQAHFGTIRADYNRRDLLVPFWVPDSVVLSDDDLLIPNKIDEEREYNHENDGSWDLMADALEDDIWPFWDHPRNPPRRAANPQPHAPRRDDGSRERQTSRSSEGLNATLGFGAGL